ncbi:MAG: helix-turn-helix domain-containing protein [Pedobacter sp.]|nr:MAG: helix-turn-helix domain-containing protein [Pedobacter sp.]
MLEELGGSFHLKYSLLALMLLELIYMGEKQVPSRQPANQMRDANERIVEQFFGKLEQQFPIEDSTQRLELIEPRDFARQLNIHVNHLNRAIKETTGKTTTELIAERIVTEAKSLLKHTRWNIAEISYCLGFEESAHFNNFFKKQTQFTPTTFRSL